MADLHVDICPSVSVLIAIQYPKKATYMKRICTLLGILLASASHADEAAIRRTLVERFPRIVIQSVTPSPVSGLFEVYTSGQIIYVDKLAHYMLTGPLRETLNKTNLSQQRLEALRRVDFSSLPLDKAILTRHGKGERKLVVFSDPECPSCKVLERELAKVDNVSIYTLLYPIEALHPGATAKADALWCAPDRTAAWAAYMLNGTLDASVAKCATPVQEIGKLGARHGIQGTPALMFSTGKRIEGALSAAEIEKQLALSR